MPRPATPFWNDNSPPYFIPGLNDRETAILDYIEASGIPNLKERYDLPGTAGADSSALAQAIIDLNGQTGYLPSGTYDVSTTSFSVGVVPNLIGDPGRTVIRTPSGAQGTAGWSFSGATASSRYFLTANVAAGAQTLTLASADLTAMSLLDGDRIQLWSDQLVPTTVAQGAVQGEILRVKSVNNGTGVITIDGTVDDAYTTANNVRIRKITMARGGFLGGIEWASQTPNVGASALLKLSWVEGFRARDVLFRDGDGPGLWLADCVDAQLDIRVQDLPDNVGANQYGYGVLVYGATRDCRIHLKAQRVRHGFTTGGAHFSDYSTNPAHTGVPAHIVVSGEAHDTTSAGFDSHSEGRDIVFSGIRCHGCQSAWQIRAPYSSVFNWVQDNCRDTTYIAWTASHSRIFPGESRGTKSGNGAAFQIGSTGNVGTIDDIHVYGLSSDDEASAGVRLTYATNVWFHQPHIRNPNAGAGSCIDVQVGCTDIFIVDGTAESALQLVAVDGSIAAGEVRVIGATTLVNTTRIAVDGSVAYRRDTLDLVGANSSDYVLTARRDDFGSNRDAFPQLAINANGQLLGQFDGTAAPDTAFYARAAKQWGMEGELRNIPALTTDTAISIRLAADTATRAYFEGTGRFFSGDGTNTPTLKFSHNATSGEFTLNEATMFAAAMRLHRRFVSSTPDTVAATDLYLGVSTSGGAKTLNLPAAVTGDVKIIKDESRQAGTNNITLDGNGSETIDGALTLVMSTNGQAVILLGVTGTGWMRIL